MKRLLILVILATFGFSFIVIQSADAETIGYYHFHNIIRPEHSPIAEPTTAKFYYGPCETKLIFTNVLNLPCQVNHFFSNLMVMVFYNRHP